MSLSSRFVTPSERARLMGKRVRIWRSKHRGEGETIEGVVDIETSGVLSFPSPLRENSNWVITGNRVLDVFEDGEWVPMFPRSGS